MGIFKKIVEKVEDAVFGKEERLIGELENLTREEADKRKGGDDD
jgi:hypothetical protein